MDKEKFFALLLEREGISEQMLDEELENVSGGSMGPAWLQTEVAFKNSGGIAC